jgi:methylated-DNA-[protein]-cysteine S-methyltransferase
MTPLPDSLLEKIASAAVREGLADAIFTRLNTPIGRLLVVQGERGVVRVAFEEEAEDHVLAEVAGRLGPRIVASDRELATTRETLEAYFAGEGDPHALPVDLGLVAAPFRRAVLETLHRDVGAGEVVTYGALAAAAGSPRAARAVGSACARNPVPIVVPCHRVLPGSGGIGSYGGGVPRKRALLELEGAMPGPSSGRPLEGDDRRP